MWLPKDERHVLAAYYKVMGKIDEEETFPLNSLCHALHKRFDQVRPYGQTVDDQSLPADAEKIKSRARQYIDERVRVELANQALAARGLIRLKKHSSVASVVVVALTLEGYDLGRRYSNWWDGTGLWYASHQNHWIMLIVSFLAGILGGLVLNVLSSLGNRQPPP